MFKIDNKLNIETCCHWKENVESFNDNFKRKKIRYREDIIDNMGADNIFRIAVRKYELVWYNYYRMW